MENFPEKNLEINEESEQEGAENAPEPEENIEATPEPKEGKIDYHEMRQIMRDFGFTEITENPAIMEHPSREMMRDQDLMYGVDINDKGEKITTIWRDGTCFARKGSANLIPEIENQIGHSLRSGALQPRNLDFEHLNLGQGEENEE